MVCKCFSFRVPNTIWSCVCMHCHFLFSTFLSERSPRERRGRTGSSGANEEGAGGGEGGKKCHRRDPCAVGSLFPLLPLLTSNVQISEIIFVYFALHMKAFSITGRRSLQMSPYIHSYCSIKQWCSTQAYSETQLNKRLRPFMYTITHRKSM